MAHGPIMMLLCPLMRDIPCTNNMLTFKVSWNCSEKRCWPLQQEEGEMLSFEERSCPRRVATLVGLLVIGSLLLGPAVAAAQCGHFKSPKPYYLPLGSSQAFGFQAAKFPQELGSRSY